MSKFDKVSYINRELSWLEFNQRVLNEASNESIPILERLKFLSISASNLDEFTMVRIGGLKIMTALRRMRRDAAGMTPAQQLDAVLRRVTRMVSDQYGIYSKIRDSLESSGLCIVSAPEEMSASAREKVKADFEEKIFPVISAVRMNSPDEFHPRGLVPHCAFLLQSGNKFGEKKQNTKSLAVVPIDGIERFYAVTSAGKTYFVPVEKIIEWNAGRIFEGMKIIECSQFRIIRNADIELREEFSADLVADMLEVLADRGMSDCVRLEVGAGASVEMLSALRRGINMGYSDVHIVDGPLALKSLMSVYSMPGFNELRSEVREPAPSADIDLKTSLFSQISQRDIGLVHPYESFDPVVMFVREAASDPNVTAIKQVLYRTSGNSPIVEALCDAALAGKHVTVLVELKARFDEARNIAQARRLEESGAHVVYGVRGLKTHAKVCMAVRREKRGFVRYVHFGTGNYNEKTAKIYSDAGFFTCRPEFGRDASDVFNAITGYSQPNTLRFLDMAPFSIRNKLIERIEAETERAACGDKAQIMMKMNSLSDTGIIDALYNASNSGVEILLNVRGICCLRPGVPGLSENITVISIVDMFLEHARIFMFHDGGRNLLYISSADAMHRNLDRRVELMIPVLDSAVKRKFMETLNSYFKDTEKAYKLNPDGTYSPRRAEAKGKSLFRCQEYLWQKAQRAASSVERTKPTMLEPYRKISEGR